MSPSLTSQQQQEKELLESFWAMVNAPDGDFGVIARLSQASNDLQSLDLMIDFLCRDRRCQEAFEQPFSLGEISLESLQSLPSDTLGYAYAEHLIKNNLKPLVAGEITNKYQFLGVHITETHDIWHVITGSDTSIYGEIQLEAFSMAQLYTSRFWLALLAKNLIKSAVFNIEAGADYLDSLTAGWLLGKQAKLLFGVRWQELWAKPLAEIQEDFNIFV